MVESYRRKPNTQCVVCDNLLYRRPFALEKTNGRAFCSTACYGLSCRKEIPCAVCGQLILSSKNKKTCSRLCANKHRTGIKYKMGRPHDKVVSQRALKLKLVNERGRTCGRCKYAKLEILQVHHKDRNRENNELNNLELICPNCHYEEHFFEKSRASNIHKK